MLNKNKQKKYKETVLEYVKSNLRFCSSNITLAEINLYHSLGKFSRGQTDHIFLIFFPIK